MTSTRHDRSADHHSRASDSAACLLVICGYQKNSDTLHRVRDGVAERFLMSPSLGDFFEVRLVDLGPRSGQRTAEVAKLALELTSRPDDAARNFSALVVIDQSADVVEELLHSCYNDPVLHRLNTSYYGVARKENRPGHSSAQDPSQPSTPIAIVPKRNVEDLVAEVCNFAAKLLDDFGSGWKPGVPPDEVSHLGSVIEPAVQGTMTRAAARQKALITAQQAEHGEEPLADAGPEEAAAQDRASQRARAARDAEIRQRGLASEVEAKKQELVALEAQIAQRKAALEAQIAQRRATLEAEIAQRRATLEAQIAQRKASVEVSTEPQPDTLPAEVTDTSYPAVTEGSPAAAIGTSARNYELLAGQQHGAPATDRAITSGPDSTARETIAESERSSALTVLAECIGQLKKGNLEKAQDYFPVLRRYVEDGVSAAEHSQYRAVMIEDRLLSPRLELGYIAAEFYDVLLGLAYVKPLDYPDYIDLEQWLSRAGEDALPPCRPLLEAIYEAMPSDAFVLAITRSLLIQPEGGNQWLRPRPGETQALINALAEGQPRPEHTDFLYRALIWYLERLPSNAEKSDVVRLLRSYGYLAPKLKQRYPNNLQRQADILTVLLQRIYPRKLSKKSTAEFFSEKIPTTALLGAALVVMVKPGDRVGAIQNFWYQQRGQWVSSAKAAEVWTDLMQLLQGSDSAIAER